MATGHLLGRSWRLREHCSRINDLMGRRARCQGKLIRGYDGRESPTGSKYASPEVYRDLLGGGLDGQVCERRS